MSERSYFEPDPVLFFEGVRSKEEFINAYLVKGNFGQSVPRDVKESFKTAEYLMAHSYFYTPMYDEAFRKVLGIHEMAVKLRCK